MTKENRETCSSCTGLLQQGWQFGWVVVVPWLSVGRAKQKGQRKRIDSTTSTCGVHSLSLSLLFHVTFTSSRFIALFFNSKFTKLLSSSAWQLSHGNSLENSVEGGREKKPTRREHDDGAAILGKATFSWLPSSLHSKAHLHVELLGNRLCMVAWPFKALCGLR